MNKSKILIRPARPSDRGQILSFTRKTFHWGDYISQTWDDWLLARNGKLLVAEEAGLAVGILHVAFLGEGEAWFEGMRIHPRRRKKGIAARLDARGGELARDHGCTVVRLETAFDNKAAQSALERFGYRRVLSFCEWAARPRNGQVRSIRLAGPSDVGALDDLWEHSWMRRATRGLAPLGDPWHWANFTRERLLDSVRQKRIWVTPVEGAHEGFAEVSGEEDVLQGMLIVGRAQPVSNIEFDLRVLAEIQGCDKCFLVGPETKHFATNALRQGFKRKPGRMLIYERRI